MTRLRSESVLPLNRQIQFGDAMSADYPDWETGQERVVFTDQQVAVATRDDRAGDVQVEVWMEPVDLELEGELVLDTEVQLIEGLAKFGNGLAGQHYDVRLRPGWHRVRVCVAPMNVEPAIVRFVLSDPAVPPPRGQDSG
jgi:hypothetical protein